MPTKTPCQRCNRVGFVRTETVIKGGHCYRLFYCGSCNNTWEVTDDGEPQDKPHERRDEDRPDRSRIPR
jgi:hypothetical protein